MSKKSISACLRLIETRRRRLLGAAVLLSLLLTTSQAIAVEVTLSNQVVGKTPELIGYNSGHFMPGSNTAAWWKYSGVNAARVWSTPQVVENGDDNGIDGDGVFSPQSFLDRRAALRADPLNPSYINWAHFKAGYQSDVNGGNKLQLDYAFDTLHSMGVSPLAVIQQSNNAYPWASASTQQGWGDRWEYWQHYYAQAFYLAKNYDVERFQMYNEPNHGSQNISQADYLERLQFASDAMQAAVADVDALYGKTLEAQMQGPVSAGGTSLFSARPGGDPRDDATGWGELILQNQHKDFLGNVDPNFNLIQTYAYQQYNAAPSTFGNEVNTFHQLIETTPGGENLKIAITEFNVHTAGVFETLPETMDSPSKAARFGAILSNLANAQPDELYVFKFSQTESGGTIKKNGVHYVDNDTAPYNIGDSTKGAEIVRLFTKGFAGAQALLATPSATGGGASDLDLAAARNTTTGRYSLLSANSSTSSRTLNLDFNALGVPQGAQIVIEEVSSQSHGEVNSVFDLPASGTISLNQPAESVFLISAADKVPTYTTMLGATDDAMVKSGANASENYGASPNLYAKNDVTNPNARNVSFIKFDTGEISTAGVDQAILRVTGENAGSASEVITTVYGIEDDNWNENTITWDNAPNLAAGLGTIDAISDNFIEDIGNSATIVGHLTGTADEQDIMLDVTDFVRNHPDSAVTFLISREVRFNSENVDDALTSLKLASKERGDDPGPQLLLTLNDLALPADFNSDGTVAGNDLLNWQAGFGISSDASRSDGDATSDGNVGGSDFLSWQRSLGTSIAQPSVASAVPEPSSLLLGLALLFVPRVRL